ncbi:MAG: hypothetical protein EDX89_11010 [Acidobacteria bacterium]|nr:MAG: hypothetical protein EDX89_11010 [Acidobacteriota bacterium]MCE7957818.1 hypothetical protein [Acidobacteria bacterium ACB2]
MSSRSAPVMEVSSMLLGRSRLVVLLFALVGVVACGIGQITGPVSLVPGQAATYTMIWGASGSCRPPTTFTPYQIVDIPADWTFVSAGYVGAGSVTPASGTATVVGSCPVTPATATPAGFQRICLTVPDVTRSDDRNVTVSLNVIAGATSGAYRLQFWAGGTWNSGANSCIEPSPATYDVSVHAPPTATVSGDATICAGQSAQIQAALTGTPPWSLTWSDSVTQTGLTTSPAARTVSPAATTVYTVTAVSDAYLSGTPSGSATVTVVASPVITADDSVLPGSTGNLASVPDAGAGASYVWTIANGTITTGAGTRQVSWAAGTARFATLGVTVTAGTCSASGSRTVRVGVDPVEPLTFTHLAGALGGPGSDDGTGSAARFTYPSGVAADDSGNVYVADSGNHTIRKVTPSGDVTTLAGLAGSYGSDDGTGSAARFYSPAGVALDGSGNVYVADAYNHTIRKVTPAGVVTTLAGLAASPGTADGTGVAARFDMPQGVSVDGSGNVYVADAYNHTIRKVTPAGSVTTLAGLAGSPGSADGTGSAARFSHPTGVAVDGSGNLHVADLNSHTIRKVTPGGGVTTLAGLAGSSGNADGTGSAARFNSPAGVAVDAFGNVHVAERDNHTIRKVTPGGVVTTLAGLWGVAGSADGTGIAARFSSPTGVAVNGSGDAYVGDLANHSIRKVTPTGVVTTLAGLAGISGSADGTGSAARFSSPTGVAVDASGSVHVADPANGTIRKVTPAGVVTTLAGLAGSSGSADGAGSAARFNFPRGIAVDASGNFYVADSSNHTIRQVTPAGVVTTLAGLAGNNGSADGTGSTARFYVPFGVAVDGSGNVYVADYYNHTIRQVTPAGVVTTLAGLAGSMGSADGTGSAARFNHPTGVAVDGSGNVYVGERGNHAIRKVTPSGDVTTFAGLAGSIGSADGTGSAARFDRPTGVAVDGTGNVYVADEYKHTIRKVTPAGVVTTLAGLADHAGNADGQGSSARFVQPSGVAVGFSGELIVADTFNYAIRVGRTALADVAAIDQAAGPVGQARQLDTSLQTATAWLWMQVRVPTGSAATLSSTTVRNPAFTPDVTGYYVFRLTASDGTATSITEVSLNAWAVATATATGDATICAGQSVQVQAALAGTPPWSVTWSDSVTQSGITASPVTRTVSPASTTVYTVTAVSDANGPGTPSGSATVTVNPVPGTPVITAPDTVASGATGLAASVESHAGSTYAWTITNGTITGGQGTAAVTFAAGAAGQLTLQVVETAGGCASAGGTKGIAVTAVSSKLHTLMPCRVLDTREAAGTFGGPALGRLQERSWPIAAGACGVPGTARALALNVTVVVPQAGGFVTLWPSDTGRPLTSTINFKPGQVRANNAVVRVTSDGQASLSAFNGSDGGVHVLVDVTGYFE